MAITTFKEALQIPRKISVVTQKLDILADKLAETTAILKVSFAPDKEISVVVPFQLKTEKELDEFENSLTPELVGFYTMKISKIIGSEPLSKRFKLVIAEDMINNCNLDGSNGKKSSDRALAKNSEDPDQCLRKAMTNVKNKLTKQKKRNNNSQICKNLNNTI
ncbi:uncharacterized protein [Drosophila suzukii]|uniref:DUF4806 domain-containing protein n=1 Tax=Drosophila suzukii TaxID=28584 RepID=A0ABM4TNR9_DROSZ